MRLLHAREFRFKEFVNDDSPFSSTPPYAILFAQMGDEVSFQEFLHLTGQSIFEPTRATVAVMTSADHVKPGFMKVIDGCHTAAERGFDWLWIDTCCIDKTSSAELSETINSMYAWYRRASICLAYLADVEDGIQDRDNEMRHFRQSEWFRRGWTLQELLAPHEILFLDRKWREIGLKSELAGVISAITRIPIHCLSSASAVRAECVASKMKWAAARSTTRAEDRAYCLLGLFEVNMPLLYGEGGFKAFKRLQEEIIRQSDDESIFVHHHSSHLSPLAYSPLDYADVAWAKDVKRGVREEFQATNLGKTAYSVTNKGVQVTAAFVKGILSDSDWRIIALNCHDGNDEMPVLLTVRAIYRGGVNSVRSSAAYVVDLGRSDREADRRLRKGRDVLASWRIGGWKSRVSEDPFDYEQVYLSNGYEKMPGTSRARKQ